MEQKIFFALNETLNSQGVKWKFVPTESIVTPANPDNFQVEENSNPLPSAICPLPSRAKPDNEIKFETFDGKSVHLYILKDSQGNPIKEFKFNDKNGKEKKLAVDGVKSTINVLDFRNTTSKAIARWKVTFDSGVDIKPENLVNAGMVKEGNKYTLSNVIANGQIPAGGVLSHKIIFASPLIDGRVAIAYNFQLLSGGLETPSGTKPVVVPASKGKYNYAEALRLTLYGYTWQTSGKKPAWNKNPHRGDCFLDDGQRDAKRDLSGGVHDAGDCIKVGLAAGSNNAQSAFGGLFYKDAYKATGQWDMLKNIVKHYSDWFIKCHEMSGDRTIRLWHWVSENPTDHATMLPPERQEAEYYKPRGLYRKAYAIGEGYEAVGEEPPCAIAASHCLTAMMLKGEDDTYGKELIRRARSLFAFAESRRGKYTSHKVYSSVSYGDEIVFAAICLYLATKEQSYLDKAEKYFYAHINYPGWTWLVDNHSSVSTFLLAYATGKQEYISRCKGWIDSWINGTAGVRKHKNSPLRSDSDWGSIPQAASAFGLAMFAHNHIPSMKNQAVLDVSKQILDYCLGENPKNFSWLIGYGNNYPKNPHHRSLMNDGKPIVGTGLWVAGEKADGFYQDRNDDWVTNETGCYSSAISMLIVGVLKHFQL